MTIWRIGGAIVFIGAIDSFASLLAGGNACVRRTAVALRTYFTFDVGERRVLLWVLGFLRKGALFVYGIIIYKFVLKMAFVIMSTRAYI